MIATAAHAGHAPPIVSIAVYAYAPASVSIVEGDIVQWNWDGPDVDHSVTSDPGSGESFDSGVKKKEGASFTYYFAKAGTYSYHCTVHDTMKGTITVAPGTQFDKTAPTLSRVRLASTTRRRAKLSFRISEDASVTLKLRRRGSAAVVRDAFSFVSAGRAAASVRTAGLPHGRYVVSVSASDATGNVSLTKTVKVTR